MYFFQPEKKNQLYYMKENVSAFPTTFNFFSFFFLGNKTFKVHPTHLIKEMALYFFFKKKDKRNGIDL